MQSSLLASVLSLLSGLGSLILRAGFITFPWLAPFWPMMSQAPGRLGGFVNQIPDSVKSPEFPIADLSEVGRGDLGTVAATITSQLATGPPTCRSSSKPCARCVPAAAVGLSQTAHSVSR